MHVTMTMIFSKKLYVAEIKKACRSETRKIASELKLSDEMSAIDFTVGELAAHSSDPQVLELLCAHFLLHRWISH